MPPPDFNGTPPVYVWDCRGEPKPDEEVEGQGTPSGNKGGADFRVEI